MSAIVAIVDLREAEVTPRCYRRVFDAASDRGLDGNAEWHAGPVAFAHHASWVTPEDVDSTQPVTTGGCFGVFDGRLDNRSDLLSELGVSSVLPHEIADSEIAVRAYGRWGGEAACHLLGDFAYAIWDPRIGALFCARDQVGTRPLYYWENGRTLVVATDIRSILAHSRFTKN